MIITIIQREPIASLAKLLIGFHMDIANTSVCVYKYACDKSF